MKAYYYTNLGELAIQGDVLFKESTLNELVRNYLNGSRLNLKDVFPSSAGLGYNTVQNEPSGV